jgi:hypothetical protein
MTRKKSDPHEQHTAPTDLGSMVMAYGAPPPPAQDELSPDAAELERMKSWVQEHKADVSDAPLNVPADIIEAVSERIETALVLLNEKDFPHPEHANARTKLFEAKEWIRRGMNRLR